MNMKNVFVVLVVGVVCLFAGASVQQTRVDSDKIVAHKECLGCCVNKCPCEDNCNCEFCLCADKEVAFSVVRKQLERIDQCGDCCNDVVNGRRTVLADREWIDWVVGYKKK